MLAEDAARELGCERVGTEHVLLGLLAEREGLAAWALESLGIELEKARAVVGRLVPSAGKSTVGQIPFSRQAKCVMELANIEVEARRLNFVGTEHVLLGLCDQLEAEPESDIAVGVLSESDVTPAQVRDTVERFVPQGAAGWSWMLRRTPGVEFRGVRGAGWIDVLSLQPDVRVRRLLIRAAAAAMDADRTVIEVGDLLAALSELPEGAEILESSGVAPARERQAAAAPRKRDWTRIDAGEQVLAALVGAQRRALENEQSTVTLDDLLLGARDRAGVAVDPQRLGPRRAPVAARAAPPAVRQGVARRRWLPS